MMMAQEQISDTLQRRTLASTNGQRNKFSKRADHVWSQDDAANIHLIKSYEIGFLVPMMVYTGFWLNDIVRLNFTRRLIAAP
jgi:hypothetical protein